MSDTADLIASLVGRTVVKAEWWEPPSTPGVYSMECGDHATLTFDDGRVIEFGGYGLHNDGGAWVEDVTPA